MPPAWLINQTVCAAGSIPTTFSAPTQCTDMWSLGPPNKYTMNGDVVTRTARGAPTITSHLLQTITQLSLYRLLDLNDMTSAPIFSGQEMCLPPAPKSGICTFSFSASDCPQGYRGLESMTTAGLATTICCPDQHELNSLTSSSAGAPKYCYGVASLKSDISTLVQKLGGNLDLSGKYEAEFYAPPLTAFQSVLSVSPTASPGSPVSSIALLATNTGTPSATAQFELSNAAKAGVGIGSTFGALVLIAALFLVFLRRRVKGTPAPTTKSNDFWGKPELHGMPIDKYRDAKELDSGIIHELDAEDLEPEKIVVEIDAYKPVAEVEADRPPVEAEAPNLRVGVNTAGMKIS